MGTNNFTEAIQTKNFYKQKSKVGRLCAQRFINQKGNSPERQLRSKKVIKCLK